MISPVSLSADLDDEALMALVQERDDAAAFAELYDRLGSRAYGLARRICRTRGDAEDALQEAFLSIWDRRSSYSPLRGAVAPWVLAVVRYRALDGLRRRRATMEVAAEQAERAAAPDDVAGEVSRADEDAELRGVLALLPPEQRRVITLAFFEGLTHTEIADALAIPVGTVKGRMRLGLGKLRAQVEPAAATG